LRELAPRFPMSNTQALTLSARIAELERIALNGKEAQNTLRRLYIEQDKVSEAIEDTQNVIYAGEDADATLSRLTAVLDAPATKETRPTVEDALKDMLPPVGEPESTPGLQIGEVLVIGDETNTSEDGSDEAQEEDEEDSSTPAGLPTVKQRLLLSLTRKSGQTAREVAYDIYLPASRVNSLLTGKTGLVARGWVAQRHDQFPSTFEITEQGRSQIAHLLTTEPAPVVTEAPALPPTPSELAQAHRQPAVLADLAAHPHSSNREIKARLGWSDSTTAKWLTRMTTQGLLTVDSSEWPYRYSLSEQAQQDHVVLAEAQALPVVVEESESEVVGPEAQTEAETESTAEVQPETVEAQPEPATPPSTRPDGTRAKMIAHLTQHGPHTAQGLAIALAMSVQICAMQLGKLVQLGRLIAFPDTTPSVFALPGTPPSKPTEVVAVDSPPQTRPAPDQAALNATMRANAALVLSLLAPGEEYKETELQAASGLPISHLRLALGNLQATGQVQRLEGATPMARATFRLEQLDLPAPNGDTLTPAGERVAAHLAHVTARSASDTATNIATGLRLTRADVDQALAVLHAQGRLTYTRVGNLVMYTLRAADAGEVAA
jgi:DNA-binding IclR family transcriptional regulator